MLTTYKYTSRCRLTRFMTVLIDYQRLGNVTAWAHGAGLTINVRKTQAIFFGSSRYVQRLKALDLPGVTLGPKTVVPFVNEVKNIEVMLDSRLTWKPQINAVKKKTNRALYGLPPLI